MKNIFLICITNPLMGGTWLPASSGNLISYCMKNEFVRENFNFYPPEFRYECLEDEDFKNKLKTSDIIGLSCYVWNQQINDTIAKYYKSINTSGLVLYGGPNIPEKFNEAMEFAKEKPFVDKFFIGPGEKNLLNFLLNNSNEGTYSKDSFDITMNRSSYQISREETLTPFQDGIYDHILNVEDNIGVPFETTRGCPYSCAFCDWGGQANSKIVKFDEEILKKEIDYFTKFDAVKWVDFCDANYGIFDRDVEILNYICERKNKIISVNFSGFAKNGSPRLGVIHDLLYSNFPMILNEFKISLQTLSDHTLKTINRDNIKTEKLLSIMKNKKDDQVVSGELILGLPGETSNSWLDTLCKTVEIGFDFLKIHRLLILPNTPINDENYIKENNIIFREFKIPKKLLNSGSIIEVFKNHGHFENLKINFSNLNQEEFESLKTVQNSKSFDDLEYIKIHEIQFWYNVLIKSNFLKQHMLGLKTDLRNQSTLFFDNLEKMPFFLNLKKEYIDTIKKILIEGRNIETYSEYFRIMMNSNMEAYKIYNNLNTAINEIKTIYPDAKFNHIKKIENQISLYRLASVHGKL